jgi:hypothetical protein
MAVMGGISLAAWNYIRATRDVDLLIALARPEVDRVVNALCANGCRPKKSPPIVAVGSLTFIQLLYSPPDEFYDVQFDLLLAENELQKSAIARRVKRVVSGISQPIGVLNCDDLILFKLLAGRMIDRADAAMLLRENRDAINMDYLLGWVHRLQLNRELADIWREAFPGENPPGTEAAAQIR